MQSEQMNLGPGLSLNWKVGAGVALVKLLGALRQAGVAGGWLS